MTWHFPLSGTAFLRYSGNRLQFLPDMSLLRCFGNRFGHTANNVLSRRFASGKSVLLGIESSCDDSCAALVTSEGRVLSSVQRSQHELNKRNRGVIPSIASQHHALALPDVVEQAIQRASIASIEKDIDAVALTIGPGLAPCLGAGLQFAQQFCTEHKKPLVLVNHMEAHAMAPTMHQCVFYPCFGFMVSGGNTEVVYIPDHLHPFKVVGETVDDACGECIDKVYRCIAETGAELLQSHSAMHGGALISHLAKQYTKSASDPVLSFPLPMARQRTADFSFAGLKTYSIRLLRQMKENGDWTPQSICRFCYFFEHAVVTHLLHKLRFALTQFPEVHTIVVAFCVCEA